MSGIFFHLCLQKSVKNDWRVIEFNRRLPFAAKTGKGLEQTTFVTTLRISKFTDSLLKASKISGEISSTRRV